MDERVRIPRRAFLAFFAVAALVAATLRFVGLGGWLRGASSPADRRATLLALAEVVLPREASAAMQKRAVEGFQAWLDGYDEGAEPVQHAGFRYDPDLALAADPGPGFARDLDELESEAERAQAAQLSELGLEERTVLVREAIAASPSRRHVALGLMDFFFESDDAHRLCFGAAIAPRSCRSWDGVEREPRSP